MKNLCALTWCLFLFGCAGIKAPTTGNSNKVTTKPIGLTEIRLLKINKTTMADAEKLFGEPERKLSFPQIPKSVIWAYLRDGFRSTPRMALQFNKSTGLLTQISWGIRDTDPELNIQKAMALFPNAQFKLLPQKWYGHYASDDRVYQDLKMGVEIEFREMRNEVETIVWMEPQSMGKK